MKEALVDTNILSLFFRGHPQVVAKFTAYLREHKTIRFSIITYYEVVAYQHIVAVLTSKPSAHRSVQFAVRCRFQAKR